LTFEQAVADAQAKTGVTVTFLNDPDLVEYGLVLVLICLAVTSGMTLVQPKLTDQACAIRTNLEAGLAALGFQNPPDPCARSITP